MGEEIIYGSINDVSGKKGLWDGKKEYDLIFTNKRIIAAMVSNSSTAYLIGGEFGVAVSKLGKGKNREKYQRLDPDSILKANSKNYEILLSDIKDVILQETGLWRFLWVYTVKGQTKFDVKKKEVCDAKRLIDMFLSEKMKNN